VLAHKVAGQRAVIDELPRTHTASDRVDAALSQMGEADILQDLLLAESQAAEAYWGAWASLPIPFPARDRAKLPSHWQTFGQRASLLSKGPRHATNPAGAILNYLYALLEAETTFACHAVGLDPGLGIFHVDQRDRDSLVVPPLPDARTFPVAVKVGLEVPHPD
jgi:CRISPR/Cas system-associated endonuclease Cas1